MGRIEGEKRSGEVETRSHVTHSPVGKATTVHITQTNNRIANIQRHSIMSRNKGV